MERAQSCACGLLNEPGAGTPVGQEERTREDVKSSIDSAERQGGSRAETCRVGIEWPPHPGGWRDIAIDSKLCVVLDSPLLVTTCIQRLRRHHGVRGPTRPLREGDTLCRHAYG